MPENKKVKVVLNADNTVNAAACVVGDAGFMDSLKQRLPFVREDDTVIVGESTLNGLASDALVLGGAAVLGDHFGVKSKIPLINGM